MIQGGLSTEFWRWLERQIKQRMEAVESIILQTPISKENVGELARAQGAFHALQGILNLPKYSINGYEEPKGNQFGTK